MKCDQSAPLIRISGKHFGNQFSRSVFIEHGDRVYRFQRARQSDAIVLAKSADRDGPFSLLHAGVGIQCENEDISQRASLLQQPDMAGMQDVIAAVGEDDGFAGSVSIAARASTSSSRV